MPCASVMNIAWRNKQFLDYCSVRVGADMRSKPCTALRFLWAPNRPRYLHGSLKRSPLHQPVCRFSP